MKKQVILIFGLTLFLFILMSSASAADNQNTPSGNMYVSVNGNDAWDGSSPTRTNSTNGPKQHISNGIAASKSGYNLNIANGTYKENKLTVSINLNIIGAGKENTTIDAQKNNLIFWIQSGANVNIKNLNLTNGQATHDTFNGNGGAIYNEGTLTIDSCILANNQGKDASDASGTDDAKQGGSGGAIYNKGSLTVTNSQLLDNHGGKGGQASATHHASTGGYGGAIYSSGVVTLQNSTFKNNYGGTGGESSSFHDGKNGGYGGAVYCTSTLTIQNCIFDTNHGGTGGSIQAGTAANGGQGGYGGAICIQGTSTITDSKLIGNYAGQGATSSDLNDAADGGHGGAIYNSGTLTISNTSILNNTAGKGGTCADLIYVSAMDAGNGGNGGGIYNTKTLTLQNCTLLNNTAGNGGDNEAAFGSAGLAGNGGAIYNMGTLTITNSDIIKNYGGTAGEGLISNIASGNGGHAGAIYNTGTVNISQSNLTKNKAGNALVKQAYGGNGGAIYNTGILTVTESQLSENHAGSNLQDSKLDGLGGALYSNTNKNVVVNFCRIVDNKLQAVYLAYAGATPVNLQNNWWGSNANPKNNITGNSISSSYYTPWLVLSVNANPTTIYAKKTSNVTASLIMNSNGQNTYQTYGKSVPDGIAVKFRTERTLGTVQPLDGVTTSGVSPTVFTAKLVPGTETVNATVDYQQASVNIAINKSASLEVTKSVNKSPIYVGDTFMVTVKLANKGPDVSSGVALKIPIPEGVELVSASVDHGTWNYDASSRLLTWNAGEVAVGESHLYLTLKAMKSGSYILSQSIDSGTFNPNSGNSTPLNIFIASSGETSDNAVNAASKTVPMQETGQPLLTLILAGLMVLGGVLLPRIKK